MLHPFLPLSGYGSVVPPLTPTAVAASLGAFFFLLLFTLFEALKVLSPQRWRHCHFAFRPASYLGGSDGTTSLSAFVGQQGQPPPRISPPSRDRSPREHLTGRFRLRAEQWHFSTVVPPPSCHLDYRGRRTPSGFSPTFTGSWHLAEGGFEPGTMD